MPHQLKKHGRFLLFNSFACLILVYILTQGSTDINDTYTFDIELESGKWAVRFLLICLAMTPLRILFGWNSAIKLRKSAGLWSFCFACVHFYYFTEVANSRWRDILKQPFMIVGLLALVILSALAITSNRWAMRRLKKNWKRLHRLVYVVGGLVMIHAGLAATASKKVLIRDPNVVNELIVYLIVLTLLLLVRVPWLQRQIIRGRRKAKLA